MEAEILAKIFFPEYLEKIDELKSGKRIAHYTSAKNAISIIKNSEIWLRNSQMMNDYSEIVHGMECLKNSWNSEKMAGFRGFFDECHDGLRSRIESIFNQNFHCIKEETFITSLSLHENYEDEYGRLSMWRAYGGKSGVALVLNNEAFTGDSGNIKAFSSPIFYRNIDDFNRFFENWSNNIMKNREFLNSCDPEIICNLVFHAFRIFSLSTKHPGFHEEKEWRVFHSPSIDGESKFISISIETINEIPQTVAKLKLDNDEELNVKNISPVDLIDKIIIGPCLYPLQIRSALAGAMFEVGFEDPLSKIHISNIPYRNL